MIANGRAEHGLPQRALTLIDDRLGVRWTRLIKRLAIIGRS
jgi:hypothetical protein